MADMTRNSGFVRVKRQVITLGRDHSYYLDEFEGLSVAHNFAGGQNDNNK